MRPRLLLLDEPTEGIQPSIIKDIGRAIAYLRALGRWRSCWSSNISISPASSATVSWCMDRGVDRLSRAERGTMDEAALKKAMAL